jgi:hypothetical protein
LSTILKALKRVDQSTPPPEDLQPGPSIIDTRKTLRSRLFRIWLQRKAILALVVVVVVIAASWLIYSQKDRLISKMGAQRQSEKPPVFQAKIEPPPRPPEQPEPRQTTPPGRSPASGKAASGPDRVSAEPPPATPSRSPLEQQVQTQQTKALKPQVRGPEPKSSAKSRLSSRPEARVKDSGQRKKRLTAKAPAKKSKLSAAPAARSYPRLDNAKLTLQAIAWSKVAAERIAVINDRIVREGESVEGYSINQIRQEDVVVNDGARSWQLEFGLR